MLASGIAPLEEVGEDMAHARTGQGGAENHSGDFRQRHPFLYQGTLRPGQKKEKQAGIWGQVRGQATGRELSVPCPPPTSLALASQRGKTCNTFIHLQVLGE